MSTFYNDPIVAAEKLGLQVIPKKGLDGGMNGQIYRQGDDIIIEYDSNMHENRARFTIAHELGHYMCGHLKDQTLFRDPSKNFTLDNYDIYEAEANHFAADFLMPVDKIDFMLHNEGITSIDTMAKLLKVSPAAMTYRLKNLGYIS
jgi:Zn-dependent peptidase ImmA (M78 family)